MRISQGRVETGSKVWLLEKKAHDTDDLCFWYVYSTNDKGVVELFKS